MVRGCMVYTERAETAAVLNGTSHVTTTQKPSTVCTPLGLIFKVHYKKLVTHLESHVTRVQ